MALPFFEKYFLLEKIMILRGLSVLKIVIY